MERNNARENRNPQKRGFIHRKKFCWFCHNDIWYIDYKDVELLKNYIMENGKILPRRMTGTCHYHQKRLTKAIKRARHMAFLPFVVR